MKKGKLDELFKYGRQEVTALAENFSQMQEIWIWIKIRLSVQ